jgi:hypothetical protein
MSAKDEASKDVGGEFEKEKKKAFVNFYQEDKTQKMTGAMRVLHGKLL